MKILILHRVAYDKIAYHRGIDHAAHEVVYVGLADKLRDIPAELRCRRIVREDLGEQVCDSVLAALNGERGFDRVISLSEYELLEAARVRDLLHVPGPSYEDVRLVRDKVAMKRAVFSADLDAPRYVALGALRDGAAWLPWTGRTVLKPTHGAGSEDVVIFDTAAACLHALLNRSTGVAALDDENPRPDGYELEEFVSGPIVHFDGLVQDGVVRAALGSRYIGNCHQYNENRPLGSYQFELDPKRLAWVQHVIGALRLRSGAFHLEAIESERGLVFLEIGNRSGGAGVPEASSRAWGVDFQSLELALLLDDGHVDLGGLAHQGRHYGWYLLPGHRYAQGRWVAPDGLDRFRQDPRVIRWHERAAHEDFDASPSYDLPALPYAGIVGAERPEAVRDYLQALFAALQWRGRDAG